MFSQVPLFNSRRAEVAALAARARLPAIYSFREFAVAGGLTPMRPACRIYAFEDLVHRAGKAAIYSFMTSLHVAAPPSSVMNSRHFMFALTRSTRRRAIRTVLGWSGPSPSRS
jgi:hypothetical protein